MTSIISFPCLRVDLGIKIYVRRSQNKGVHYMTGRKLLAHNMNMSSLLPLFFSSVSTRYFNPLCSSVAPPQTLAFHVPYRLLFHFIYPCSSPKEEFLMLNWMLHETHCIWDSSPKTNLKTQCYGTFPTSWQLPENPRWQHSPSMKKQNHGIL